LFLEEEFPIDRKITRFFWSDLVMENKSALNTVLKDIGPALESAKNGVVQLFGEVSKSLTLNYYL
jgi:hypothetical protein